MTQTTDQGQGPTDTRQVDGQKSAFRTGDPVVHRGISVTPLFPAVSPVCTYVSLAAATATGLEVTEVSDSGDVGELVVINPTGDRVLLYDGEEVAGAKQDRILNVSVLVDAHSSLTVPVSCIESGRWARVSDTFRPAGRTPAPQVRRAKAEMLHEQPLRRGFAQSAVWEAVEKKEAEHGFRSGTSAHGDLIEHERPRLRELTDAFALQPGQCGIVLATDGAAVCLDAVSRPEVFAQLHEALLTGYMLDALHHLDGTQAPDDAADTLLGAVATASRAERPAEGLGIDVRLAATGMVGSALELDGEVIQLTAFASTGRRTPRSSRIARPTRRFR